MSFSGCGNPKSIGRRLTSAQVLQDITDSSETLGGGGGNNGSDDLEGQS